MVYLVSYDLNEPDKDYKRLIDAISRYGNPCHVLKSQWLIQFDKSAKQLCDELTAFVDESDELFVCEVNQNRFGKFKPETIKQFQIVQGQMLINGLLGAVEH